MYLNELVVQGYLALFVSRGNCISFFRYLMSDCRSESLSKVCPQWTHSCTCHVYSWEASGHLKQGKYILWQRHWENLSPYNFFLERGNILAPTLAVFESAYCTLNFMYCILYVWHTAYTASSILKEWSVCHPFTLQYTGRLTRMHFI